MNEDQWAGTRLSRRRALALGGGVVGGAFLGAGAAMPRAASGAPLARGGSLPVSRIEQIVGAEGSVSGGVLDVPIGREDIGHVTGPLGVVFTPEFEIHGDLAFQPLRGGSAFMNGDLAVLPDE